MLDLLPLPPGKLAQDFEPWQLVVLPFGDVVDTVSAAAKKKGLAEPMIVKFQGPGQDELVRELWIKSFERDGGDKDASPPVPPGMSLSSFKMFVFAKIRSKPFDCLKDLLFRPIGPSRAFEGPSCMAGPIGPWALEGFAWALVACSAFCLWDPRGP